MAANLADLPWMTPETRAAARAKLEAFNVKIGYPDKFETYDGMVVAPGRALDNAIAAVRWASEDGLRDLREPVDKAKWLMTPQTVNAYYMPPANEIVFPAAILQPPYFNPMPTRRSTTARSARSSARDRPRLRRQGSQYRRHRDAQELVERRRPRGLRSPRRRLAAQYDAVCPFDDGKTCHNGRLTLGENIGDLGGLSMAYQAYKLSLGGKPAR
jgi:putative endopeptidase